MTSTAVIALRCLVKRGTNVDAGELERIDRGEILYVNYEKGRPGLPQLSRDGKTQDKGKNPQPVITAEAVTLYRGQEGQPVSVPIVVLGKTEVVLNNNPRQTVTLDEGGRGMPGTSLYLVRPQDEKGKTVITSKSDGGYDFLGTVVHKATTTTYSVDLIVNFAK